MATRTIPKAQPFSMKLPLLSEGRSDRVLCRTETVQIRGKVYAQGGENALHAHLKQDHAFFILSGQATVHDEEENLTVLGPLEGVLLPAGAYYWFQSTGDENLVLLRFAGNFDQVEKMGDDRVNLQGNPFPGGHADNKGVQAVPSGKQFQL
jgi:mannose-6-phosphate isomerase-like protein (cupin superfamily)